MNATRSANPTALRELLAPAVSASGLYSGLVWPQSQPETWNPMLRLDVGPTATEQKTFDCFAGQRWIKGQGVYLKKEPSKSSEGLFCQQVILVQDPDSQQRCFWSLHHALATGNSELGPCEVSFAWHRVARQDNPSTQERIRWPRHSQLIQTWDCIWHCWPCGKALHCRERTAQTSRATPKPSLPATGKQASKAVCAHWYSEHLETLS